MRMFLMSAAAGALLLGASTAGAAVVDFEDLGVASGTQLNTPSGVPQASGGFLFTPGPSNIGPNDMHFHNQDGLGDNGGTNMGNHDDVVMTKVGGGVFSLQSFDYEGFITEPDLRIVGELFGGGFVSLTFTPDGDPSTYQTVNLAGWNNLVAVTWAKTSDQTSGFFLDNIAVDGAVPEPASWAMMIGGFALAGSALRRRQAAVQFA